MEIFFPDRKKVDVAAGSFVIHTDQSIVHGGDGTAPEPFDVFLASIGACVGVYVLGFCQARSIDTRDVRIEERPEYEDGVLKRVVLELQVPDDFPRKYVPALQAAAEKCAVKRAFNAKPLIEIKVA
ncbi:MAG TPA: OsmC family protein [Myxococcales bacterium]|nr:OsmC family protein [Myxococcales bacterium]